MSLDEETDRLWRRVLWSLPTGLFLVGSAAGGTRNLMTANLVVQIATRPRVVGVAVEREALTHRLVSEGGCFAVSVLDREDRAIVRTFAKPAEETAPGELNGCPVLPQVTGAPILERAAAFLDCRVVGQLDFESHSLFAGEVVGAGFQGQGEGADILRMEDTRMKYGG